jgi:uncharacterized protein
MDQLTRFLVTMHRYGAVAVFSTLFPRPIFFTEKQWFKVKSGKVTDRQTISELKKRRVLVKPGDDEKLLEKVRAEALASEGVSILYLMLTSACNLCCRYCFQKERHGTVPIGPSMTRDIARMGLDLFVKNLRPGGYAVQIQLYGGEPLLNWETFVSSVSYIKQLIEEQRLPKLTKIIMLTNGTLLTEGKAAFIKAHNIEVGLSVDGPAGLTNENRVFASGEGTYKNIMGALALLKKYKIPTMLSITATPDNVTKLSEIVSWAKRSGVKFIGFNPIGGESYSHVAGKMGKQEYDRLLAENLVKAFKKTAKCGMYEARIGRKVIEFVRRGFIFSECGAINSQLIIQPDGKVGHCHASRRYDVGSVFDPDFSVYDKGETKIWRQALPVNKEGCLRCPAISLCGYGCFHNVWEDTGGVSARDKQSCSYTRRLIEMLVWELYKTKNLK